MIHNLMIHRHRASSDVREIFLDIGDAGLETAERGELLGDACGEGCGCAVFDVSKEVLDTDFFCFFCFYGGRDVEECFTSFCSVLSAEQLAH